MKLKISILLLLTFFKTSFAQDPMSKADILYYEYAYADAIQEYQKEILDKPLSNQQFLNLAESYFKTADYQRAADTYFEVYKKDSDISSNHFNMMLKAMTRTSGLDRVRTVLASRASSFPKELIENADLNYQLINSSDTTALKFTIFNIESNSPQADFSPTFYQDQLLFTSGRTDESKSIYAPSGESYLNIYVAPMSEDGSIINPNSFTVLPETKFHQATPFYSEDLNQFFYILSNAEDGDLIFDENGKNSLAIGTVDKKGIFRYLMRDLGTSFYYPFYDKASDRLYFAANLKDSHGGTDLYYVSTINGVIMSSPTNLGPRINSPGNEIAPYIFDGSLYFASDVFYGLGGMDLYKSEFQGDDLFSIPINLGSGMNTSEDDFGLIIKPSSEKGYIGYFASNRKGGKGQDDIYGFNVPEMPGPRTLALIGSVVNTSTDRGISKVLLRLLDKDNKTIKEIYTDEDGKFRLEVPWQDQITIETIKPRHSALSLALNKEQLAELQQSELQIDMANIDDLVEQREEQTVIKFKKFYFARGSAQITPEISQELDKVVSAIAQFPQLQLRIEAHTDSRGGSSTNFRISQSRADVIKKYLQDNGVSSSNILYSVGYGEDKIINQCTSGVYCLDFLHRQNERHLIVVLNYNLLK